MTATFERPRLRPYLAAGVDSRSLRHVYLWDQLKLSRQPRRMSLQEFRWVQLFDGQRTLRDIQAEAIRLEGGGLLPIELFQDLAKSLDEALLLDSPRFQKILCDPIREPACIGCYEAEPVALRRQLRLLFTGPNGPGLPGEPKPDGRLCGVLVPHIDYHRGGHTFAWGFKEVFEHSDATVFVIIGTSHYASNRYTLTRKNFKSPLGVVETDQSYITRLVAHHGDGLFDAEVTHLPEHSIELEVVLLQYLYEGRRPFRIVPLLVGTFQDCVEGEIDPQSKADIARMTEALRRAEAETPEPVCYIISGDLAHLGPKFGDQNPVAEPLLSHSREQDKSLLRRAELADTRAFFQIVAAEGDRRRICGLPPTYTMLEAVRPACGKLLHYGDYVHPRGFESVSFASVAFYR